MDTAIGIDETKLQAFVGRVVGDFGAALSSTLVYDRRQARAVQSHGQLRSGDAGGAGGKDRYG